MIKIQPARAQSPLAHRQALAVDGLSMRERPFLIKINLRGRLSDLGQLTEKVCGLAAPAAGRSITNKTGAVHWLSPDRLLYVAEKEECHLLSSSFANAPGGDLAHITDVSHHETVIELKGMNARNVLQKISTLDLHPDFFKKDDVAGTLFSRAHGVLAARDSDRFDLLVRRSFADYLWCLLANAGYEYGLPMEEPVAGEILRGHALGQMQA